MALEYWTDKVYFLTKAACYYASPAPTEGQNCAIWLVRVILAKNKGWHICNNHEKKKKNGSKYKKKGELKSSILDKTIELRKFKK